MVPQVADTEYLWQAAAKGDTAAMMALHDALLETGCQSPWTTIYCRLWDQFKAELWAPGNTTQRNNYVWAGWFKVAEAWRQGHGNSYSVPFW